MKVKVSSLKYLELVDLGHNGKSDIYGIRLTAESVEPTKKAIVSIVFRHPAWFIRTVIECFKSAWYERK